MRKNRATGFTLIEMALVLVIVGILLAGTTAGIKPVLDSSHTSTTNSKLDRVELALLAYVMQNGCLPCPANGSLASSNSNAGWSHSATSYYGPNGPTNQPCAGTTAGGCTSVRGVVPWNTLGITESDTTDAWSDRITYAVDGTLTVTAGSSMTRTSPASYPAGTLTVTDNTPTNQTTAAAYVLVSHGRDRRYAYAAGSGAVITSGQNSTPQADNDAAASGTTFRQDKVNLIEGANYFDDIVRYRTAPAIIIDCGANACGNPGG